MKVSVVISTLSRHDLITRILDNISNQTLLPYEVIIIDAGSEVLDLSSPPVSLNERILYNRFHKCSLTQARALGSELSSGQYVCFFDDDIILPLDYIENAVKYLDANVETMGVGGVYRDEITSTRKGAPSLLSRFFQVYSTGHQNRILASGWADYVRGKYQGEISDAEWLFGCNFVLRSDVFRVVKFEVDMVAWSFLEDVFLGAACKKQFGCCMKVLPTLEVEHAPTETSGEISPITLKMRILYRYVFWLKYIKGDTAYSWSRIKFLLGMLANMILTFKQKPSSKVLLINIKSLTFACKNPSLTLVEANEFIFSKH